MYGTWNITVDVSGQLFTQSFQVAEYVLPKFRVDVQLPKYGTLQESTTTAVIRDELTLRLNKDVKHFHCYVCIFAFYVVKFCAMMLKCNYITEHKKSRQVYSATKQI